MTIQEAVKKLDELEMTEFAYGHAMGMLFYDGDTVAPKRSVEPRGRTMGILSGESYKLSTGDESMKLMDYLTEREDELSPDVRRRVELRRKQLKEMRSVPMEEYVAFTELQNEASSAWHDAKEKSDYALFEPYLVKIIDTNRRFAQLTEPDMDPYEYCLDKYEEGLTKEKCEDFFSTVKDCVVPLMRKIKSVGQVDDSVLNINFPISAQRQLSDRLMEIMGIDRTRCGIGETEHPFTTNFSKYDVRITTNYHENAFTSSMYSVIHEGGHALYELGTGDELQYTSLAGGVSMGVHESQSRFYENILGRNREYIGYVYPDIVKLCPEAGRFTPEELYRAVNKTEASLIRTEADELTYSLHVMIRYEMEKKFMQGGTPSKEFPDVWNALYREYLGIEPKNDREGILQDSHWSGGSIGYFPSYALGSAYGAQLLSVMRETVDVSDCLKNGRFEPINAWLRERIWKYGCLKSPSQLLLDAMGKPFDPRYYTDYLTKKMADVYGI